MRLNQLPIQVFIGTAGRLLENVDCRGVSLRQRLSEAFELRLLLASQDHNFALDELVGEQARVELPEESGLSRITGIIRRVAQRSIAVEDDTVYEVTIAPPLWLLSQRTRQRIFKDLTVPEILQRVLDEYGLDGPTMTALRGIHRRREYTVQYRETDYDFVRRLLAEEGFSFWFDHERASAMVVADDTTAMTPLRAGTIPYIPGFSPELSPRPHVEHVAIVRTIRPGAVALRDYNFENPVHLPQARALDADGAQLEAATLERYESEVGEFHDDALGGQRASQILEEGRWDSRSIDCTASLTVSPGTRFVLDGHPRTDVDGELLVVASELDWTAGGAEGGGRRLNRLTCIPAVTPFRPARLAKPRIWGTQTAFVTCAEGKEIDVDEHGRVHVMFRWDRRDIFNSDSSRRVRVSQGWAGGNYGFTQIPRVGHEVIIAYLDGDPDEPVIVGRLHNGFNRPPLDLPAQQSQSVWKSKTTPEQTEESFNMIRMEDAAGAELLELRAQRDFVSTTLRNAGTTVGVDHSLRVGGKSSHQVVGGYSMSSASTSIGTGPYEVTATKATITSEDDISLLAGDERIDKSASHLVETGTLTMQAAYNVVVNTGGFWVAARSLAQVAAPTIKLQAGGSSITLTHGGISIESSGPVTINGSVVKLNC